MIIKEFIPESEQLKKYVKSIYFINSRDNIKTEFVYYPHYIESINIFFNSRVEVNHDIFSVEKKLNHDSVILTASKTKFRTAVIKGGYDIIGIQFFPLDINHFFDKNTFSRIENGVYEINNIELDDMATYRNTKDRLNQIETYLLSIFNYKKQVKLREMIQLIHQSKGNMRMNILEHKFNLSRRTILRQFKKFLHCSFEDYKNTIRFRLAIENFYDQNNKTTNIIGDIAFYDQSDFINHFKALSGESPKKLLKKIANNPKSINYFWKFK